MRDISSWLTRKKDELTATREACSLFKVGYVLGLINRYSARPSLPPMLLSVLGPSPLINWGDTLRSIHDYYPIIMIETLSYSIFDCTYVMFGLTNLIRHDGLASLVWLGFRYAPPSRTPRRRLKRALIAHRGEAIFAARQRNWKWRRSRLAFNSKP